MDTCQPLIIGIGFFRDRFIRERPILFIHFSILLYTSILLQLGKKCVRVIKLYILGEKFSGYNGKSKCVYVCVCVCFVFLFVFENSVCKQVWGLIQRVALLFVSSTSDVIVLINHTKSPEFCEPLYCTESTEWGYLSHSKTTEQIWISEFVGRPMGSQDEDDIEDDLTHLSSTSIC